MLKWIIIIILTIVIIGFLLIRSLFKEPEFTKPSGKYKVGTHLFELIDESRKETLMPGYSGNRKIAVQVFYPASESSSGELFPLMDKRLSEAFSKLYKIPSGSGGSALSHSIIDAEADNGNSFPLILFSHGGFSFNTQNLSTMEELASNGYIVFALSHTYEAMVSLFPNGDAIDLADPSYLQDSMNLEKNELVEYGERLERLKSGNVDRKIIYRELGDTFYSGIKKYLHVRLDDVYFFLGQLEMLNSSDSFILKKKMDLNNIGMLGHSLGGITTSYICSDEKSPVKSGINLDAPVITYSDEELQLRRPFAFFYSTETGLPKIGKINMSGTNDYYGENSDEEAFSLTFHGSAHYNFSDFNFMPPFFRFTPLLGKVDGPTMSVNMNNFILGFFDYTLKGDEKNVYSTAVNDIDEVTFNKQ